MLELIAAEQRNGVLHGVIVQLGGQTPLKLAAALEAAKVPILGTTPDAIDLAEDRKRFQELLSRVGLRQPENGAAMNLPEAMAVARRIGYPVVIRPSYVLVGRAMEIVRDDAQLSRYMTQAFIASGTNPVLIDSYLQDAIEVDVDALADGVTVHVAGIMEHIEEAGVHSGDSACSLPPHSLSPAVIAEITRQTGILARALNVVGLMNVQFAIQAGTIFILEVNPRASRTVPFVAKTMGIPFAKIASRVMAGEPLAGFGLVQKNPKHVAVKEAVFPFVRFSGVDTLLGPEMKSTGEVMGLDRNFERAFAKSQLASGSIFPETGTAFFSVRDRDKPAILAPARSLQSMGFELMATGGTAAFLEQAGLRVKRINKVLEGQPHIADAIKNGDVQMVFNTTEGAQAIADSCPIRQSALMSRVPYYTTAAGIQAAVKGLEAARTGALEVSSLQSYIQ